MKELIGAQYSAHQRNKLIFGKRKHIYITYIPVTGPVSRSERVAFEAEPTIYKFVVIFREQIQL